MSTENLTPSLLQCWLACVSKTVIKSDIFLYHRLSFPSSAIHVDYINEIVLQNLVNIPDGKYGTVSQDIVGIIEKWTVQWEWFERIEFAEMQRKI